MDVTDVLQECGPHDIMPRFQCWRERTVPAALQGESRFKNKPAPCRCVVPPRLPNRLLAMRQATRSCCEGIDSLRHHLGGFRGTRGSNNTMMNLCKEAVHAFDWRVLTAQGPTVVQAKAFIRLATMLQPILRTTS